MPDTTVVYPFYVRIRTDRAASLCCLKIMKNTDVHFIHFAGVVHRVRETSAAPTRGVRRNTRTAAGTSTLNHRGICPRHRGGVVAVTIVLSSTEVKE